MFKAFSKYIRNWLHIENNLIKYGETETFLIKNTSHEVKK